MKTLTPIEKKLARAFKEYFGIPPLYVSEKCGAQRGYLRARYTERGITFTQTDTSKAKPEKAIAIIKPEPTLEEMLGIAQESTQDKPRRTPARRKTNLKAPLTLNKDRNIKAVFASPLNTIKQAIANSQAQGATSFRITKSKNEFAITGRTADIMILIGAMAAIGDHGFITAG